ncbi:hypothetical protein MMC14_001992 [Varicellaria rhodocarpa]|nr:hypothetical protein [Varicellaria rhodocarpa]
MRILKFSTAYSKFPLLNFDEDVKAVRTAVSQAVEKEEQDVLLLMHNYGHNRGGGQSVPAHPRKRRKPASVQAPSKQLSPSTRSRSNSDSDSDSDVYAASRRRTQKRNKKEWRPVIMMSWVLNEELAPQKSQNQQRRRRKPPDKRVWRDHREREHMLLISKEKLDASTSQIDFVIHGPPKNEAFARCILNNILICCITDNKRNEEIGQRQMMDHDEFHTEIWERGNTSPAHMVFPSIEEKLNASISSDVLSTTPQGTPPQDFIPLDLQHQPSERDDEQEEATDRTLESENVQKNYSRLCSSREVEDLLLRVASSERDDPAEFFNNQPSERNNALNPEVEEETMIAVEIPSAPAVDTSAAKIHNRMSTQRLL